MSKPLTTEQLEALKAWVLVLQRAHASDRRLISIAALADLGSGKWIGCRVCDQLARGGPRLHIHEAFRHLDRNQTEHTLYVADDAVDLVDEPKAADGGDEAGSGLCVVCACRPPVAGTALCKDCTPVVPLPAARARGSA